MSSVPMGPVSDDQGNAGQTNGRLSYKFQRLRESIRNAVLQGEFADRLPGERTLGKRFGANAKTINKALSDLTAEGLLIRQIGRGTFVAKRESAPQADDRVTHILATADATCDPVALTDVTSGLQNVEMLSAGVDSHGNWPLSAWPVGRRRDSKALVLWVSDPLTRQTPRMLPSLTAELHRRQVPFLIVGASGATERVNCVAPDYSDAGYRVAEHLIQCGCKAIVPVAVEQTSREIEAALAAIQAATVRFGATYTGPVTPEHFATEVMMRVGAAANGRAPAAPEQIGVICIGLAAFKAVQSRRITDTAGAGSMKTALIAAPGQRVSAAPGVTTYEWDMTQFADRVCEWSQTAKSALQPKETYVPGTLFPRHGLTRRVETSNAAEATRSATPPGARTVVEAVR